MQHKLVTLTLLLIFVVCSGTLSFAKTLFSDDFSKGADRWEVGAGKWGVKNGQYVQSTTDAFLSSFVKAIHWDPEWSQYTLELKAMKLGGKEGWDIVFGIGADNKVPAVKGDRNNMTFYDWNIAGWGNTRSVLRKRVKGAGSNVLETQVGKKVENNKWYQDEEKGFEAKEGPKDGRIGFSLFGTSAAFDDVVVYDEGGLSVDSSMKLATRWSQIKQP